MPPVPCRIHVSACSIVVNQPSIRHWAYASCVLCF